MIAVNIMVGQLRLQMTAFLVFAEVLLARGLAVGEEARYDGWC
jgi:hypothetical protein